MEKRRGFQTGLTLIEVVIAMAVLAIIALGIAQGILRLHKDGQTLKDKTFASQKLIQMTEELRGLIANASNPNIGVLDNYDNGTAYSSIMTTRQEVTDPADPISGNGDQKFLRQINIVQIPNEPLARQVYVKIFYKKDMLPIAQTMSVLYTIQNQFLPTQVYDVYVLCVENVPGWWSALWTMKPTFDSMLQDMQNRNPGLEFRIHYITQLSYGRDPSYRPYSNSTTYTDQTAPAYVYFYPGLMHLGASDFYYYPPNYISGNISQDGTQAGLYPMADQYNHAVRFPDEVNLYENAVSYAIANGQQTPEITWRMLLEEMNSNPTQFKNILLIDLHAEMLPLPPIRNYSDAAKDPLGSPNKRLVVHPENLYYPASATSIKLRVYPYVAGGNTLNGTNVVDTISETTVISSATIVVKNVAPAALTVTAKYAVGNSSNAYTWQTATAGTQFTVGASGSDTLITLYNLPVRHAYHSVSRTGLPSASRLYGLEYIPCEVAGNTSFIQGAGDLITGVNSAKNTARWVITLSPSSGGTVPSGMYTFETRISTGVTATAPNLSKTYTWVGTSQVPATEQYQFIGDARHMPYIDVKMTHGYNWYGTPSVAGYTGFSKVNTSGWTTAPSGALNVDVPRFFQLVRQGVLNSGGIWSTISGWSSFYIGLGGEMGDDGHAGFTDGLPIKDVLWNPAAAAGTIAYVNEIIDGTWANSATRVNPRLIVNAAKTWVALPWIGELYPDSQAAAWNNVGNLPSGAGNYYRENYTAVPFNSFFGFNPVKRTGQAGSASFVNGNTTGSGSNVFNHDSGSSGNVTATGNTITQDFNFPLPATLSSSGNVRPFTLSGTSYTPPEWAISPYTTQRTATSLIESYFTSDLGGGWSTSGMVSVTSGTNVGNMVVNGSASQTNFGTAEIGKLTLITMIRAFMQAGNPALSQGRVYQVPLVSISTPTIGQQFLNPNAITISWSSAWTRWDGQPYTSSYSGGYTQPATTMQFNVKISLDSGKHWVFIEDNTATSLGTFDSGHAESSPYSWSTPSATFPEGNYLICVEGYRQGYSLHYTYHERELFIQR
jgi:prepilin-type N-terminal cleavage/methylation domain-containing protein